MDTKSLRLLNESFREMDKMVDDVKALFEGISKRKARVGRQLIKAHKEFASDCMFLNETAEHDVNKYNRPGNSSLRRSPYERV